MFLFLGLHLPTLWIRLHWGAAWGTEVCFWFHQLDFKAHFSVFFPRHQLYRCVPAVPKMGPHPCPPAVTRTAQPLRWVRKIKPASSSSTLCGLTSALCPVPGRTWITSISSHSPPRSPWGFSMRTSTFGRRYPRRTTGRWRTGESGRWRRGRDTALGSRGADTSPGGPARATKECPR